MWSSMNRPFTFHTVLKSRLPSISKTSSPFHGSPISGIQSSNILLQSPRSLPKYTFNRFWEDFFVVSTAASLTYCTISCITLNKRIKDLETEVEILNFDESRLKEILRDYHHRTQKHRYYMMARQERYDRMQMESDEAGRMMTALWVASMGVINFIGFMNR